VLAEFMLILPVLLLLTFGIVEGGRLIWAYNTVSHAAREGARYAIVHGSEYDATTNQTTTAVDIENYVQSRAAGLDAVQVSTSWVPDNKAGSVVRVNVQYTFDTILPLLLPALKSTVLSATSEMVISF